MEWEAAKDVGLGLYGIFLSTVFASRDGYFAYPLTALLLTAVWETVGWNGSGSLITLAVVVGSVAIGLCVRRRRGEKLVEDEPTSYKLACVVLLGGFALVLTLSIILGLF